MRRVLLALGLLVAASCASVLGIDDHEDAAAKLCACPDVADLPGCEATTRARLDEADAQQQRDWLEGFARDCGDSCDAALACHDRAPVCTPREAACTVSGECCGVTEGAGCCENQEGSTCCSDCLTCGEIFADYGGAAPISRCAESVAVIASLAACICDACQIICAAACPGLREDVSFACAACLKDVVKPTGACYLAYAACAADQPQGP